MKILLTAGTLLCALSTGACHTTLVPGSITPGDISAGAGTMPSGDVAKWRTKIAQVQEYARLTCRIVPTVEAIVNIFAASNPAAATVKSVTDIACGALLNGTTSYTADMPAKAKARAKAPDAPVGQTVTGTAIVNGTPIVVTGKVVR